MYSLAATRCTVYNLRNFCASRFSAAARSASAIVTGASACAWSATACRLTGLLGSALGSLGFTAFPDLGKTSHVALGLIGLACRGE